MDDCWSTDYGGDDYSHMFTDVLHSVGIPSTPVGTPADEGQYRAIDTSRTDWYHKVGGESKWYADNTGNLYNSKGNFVNYKRDASGQLVFTDSSDVTRYLPDSAVKYLQKNADSISKMNLAGANQLGKGMDVVPEAKKAQEKPEKKKEKEKKKDKGSDACNTQ
jgi:hypothetical protein